MKKRTTLALFACALALTLCACTDTAAPAQEATQEPAATEQADPPAAPAKPAEPDVPQEYKNALKSAQNYMDFMPMSKQGLYDQLTSEYGDQFPAEAALYAVDHIDADWKEAAAESAKNYYEEMGMSKQGVYDQLVSEYGEKFTPEEAEYAISTLE